MDLSDNLLNLEDLARRYDAQVLREYLLEQEEIRGGGGVGGILAAFAMEDRDSGMVLGGNNMDREQRTQWAEVHEMRPRWFRRLRLLLVVNFLAYWATVAYGGYACHLRSVERGTKAIPPLDAALLGVFILGTQGTVELAASAALARPSVMARGSDVGLRWWDGAGWLTGLGARAAVLLDVLCLPIIGRGSELLFVLSLSTLVFAIIVFVMCVQLRLLCGLFCASDLFSYDKPDLFFKGRDAHGMSDSLPMPGRQLGLRDDEESDLARGDRAPPVNTIKVANCAHFSDMAMLHAVIIRLYVPVSCQETQEFVKSASNFSRCFCEDVVQCSVKFFFLMDYEANPLVFLSLLVSAAQAVGACFYSSHTAMDLRSTTEGEVEL
mmetsp:Transcript_107978/g.312018  ORF Transcript_107978/g.312018 Transcript_107978/m.312018 type:complete len:380 (-) Transcript_107978:54-1193(-)